MDRPGYAVSLLRKCHSRVFFGAERTQAAFPWYLCARYQNRANKTLVFMDVREPKRDAFTCVRLSKPHRNCVFYCVFIADLDVTF